MVSSTTAGLLIVIGALALMTVRHLLVWRIDRHQPRLWLAFNIAGIGFSVARICQLSTTSSELALVMIRAQYVIVLGLPWLAFATLDALCGVRSNATRLVLWGALPIQLLCLLPGITGPASAHLDAFGHHYYGASPGVFAYVVPAFCILVIFAMRRHVLPIPASLEPMRRTFRIAFATFVVFGIHDMLMPLLFSSVHLLQYAFVVVAIGAARLEGWRHAVLYAELEARVDNKRAELAAKHMSLERAVRNAERHRARYRHLANATREGVIFSRNMRVIDSNRATSEILNRPESALCGAVLTDLFEPASHPALARLLAGDPGPLELTATVPGDTSVVVSVKATTSSEASLGTRVLLIRDVTSEHHLHARLVLADRLAAIGMLAAGTAHEINNPLAYVMGNAEMLEEELSQLGRQMPDAPLDQFHELVTDIINGALQIKSVVRDLSTMSRERPTEQTTVDVRAVLRGCLGMAATQLRHRARVVEELDAVPPVFANEARLFQVFLNLIVNAAQAIPEGNLASNEIRVRTRTHERNVVVEIEDTGIGMEPAVRSRIFDAFFTTKEVGKGTGLGLSISYGIIASLGGTIECTSEVGKGTCFRVTLQAAVAAVAETTKPQRLPTEIPAKRVLIVDDEEMVATGMARMLAGHQVDIALSGREAFERIRNNQYDIVLCDVMMPDINGIQLHTQLVEQQHPIAQRFVFMTGGVLSNETHSALDTERWLLKPIRLGELRRFVADPHVS